MASIGRSDAQAAGVHPIRFIFGIANADTGSINLAIVTDWAHLGSRIGGLLAGRRIRGRSRVERGERIRCGPHSSGGRGLRKWGVALWLVLLASVLPARAALQFDVFVGYGDGGAGDGVVREGCWFPVACEVFNDGPGFDALFEFSSKQVGVGQSRRMKIELPTNTRKRFVFPVFAGASRYATWNARLLDARGKGRAERLELRCRDIAWETPLLGGLPRVLNGLPSLPQESGGRGDLQPQVARLTVEQFPDNPLALEGLSALYLNSEKCLELKTTQVGALLAWVHGGGHLILGLEQAQDVTSTPWLRDLVPVTLAGVTTNRSGGALQAWLQSGASLRSAPEQTVPRVGIQPALNRPARAASANPYASLAADGAFENAEFALHTGSLVDGEAQAGTANQPLVVTAPRGRGQITMLLFSPEREPFKSWKNRPWFWARTMGLSGDVLQRAGQNLYGGWGIDGVMGAMIDTRQVRKLPVEWLLALLVVYLLVIGPVDQWWLKKINRPMLTWLTFPAYVVLFSLLIYWIGYRLRAGETEWNELHVVDVLPRNEQAELRGRTFGSLYSSVNARYRLASDQPFAALRGEYLGPAGGASESSRTEAEIVGNGFQAEIVVPVWTSQLCVSDWQQPSPVPYSATLVGRGAQLEVSLQNHLPRKLGPMRMIFQERLFDLGDLAAQESKTLALPIAGGVALADFVRPYAARFQTAIQYRRQVFGREHQSRLDLTPDNLTAVSFIATTGLYAGSQRSFLYPPGFDLTPCVARGDAVFLAWDGGQTPMANPLLRYKPPRLTQNTLLRLVVSPTRPTAPPISR